MSQFILDLINAKNSSSIQLSDINFDLPQVASGTRNTTVKVNSVDNGPYTGDVTVRYNRLHIDNDVVNHSSNDATDKTFNIAGLDKLSELLSEINERFQLKAELTADEIEEAVFADDSFFENGKEYIKLKIKPESYHFIGELDLEIFTATIPLNSVILDEELDGLIYPFPNP